MKSNWIIISIITLLVILIVGAGALVITFYVTKNVEFKTHLRALLSGVKRLAYDNTTLFAGLGVFLLALALCNMFYFFGQQKTSNWFIRGLKYAQVVDNIDSIEMVPSNDYRARLYFTNVKIDKSTVKFMGLNLPPTKNCRVQRMYEQLTDVSFQAYNHLLTAREFMVQSFLCISMSSIFYTIAFAILIYVTKAGWKDTSPVVTAVLICCTSIGTFFFGLTTIFKQEQNANKNLELYLAHINLEQEMRSRISRSDYLLKFHDQECSQLLNTFKKETKTADSLITYFDAEMGKINKIELGFDAAGITKLRSELEASKPKP